MHYWNKLYEIICLIVSFSRSSPCLSSLLSLFLKIISAVFLLSYQFARFYIFISFYCTCSLIPWPLCFLTMIWKFFYPATSNLCNLYLSYIHNISSVTVSRSEFIIIINVKNSHFNLTIVSLLLGWGWGWGCGRGGMWRG